MNTDNEALSFAKKIAAKDLKTIFDNSQYYGLFKQRNYFLLDKDKYLIVKISRSNKPFWGIRKKFVELFDKLTEETGNYYFVGLVSENSGWILSKHQLQNQIVNGSISYSEKQGEYKINTYNLKDRELFASIESFLTLMAEQ